MLGFTRWLGILALTRNRVTSIEQCNTVYRSLELLTRPQSKIKEQTTLFVCAAMQHVIAFIYMHAPVVVAGSRLLSHAIRIQPSHSRRCRHS